MPSLTKKASILPLALGLGWAVVWAALLGPLRALEAENFIFYFPSRHEALQLRKIDQRGYLPLEKTLRLFGRPVNKRERQRRVSWRFNRRQLEVRAGQTRVRVGRKRVDLPFPVRHLDGEWWVPISFLTEVLPEIVPDAMEYHAGTRRIFIGEVEPNSFELRFDSLLGGARLTLQFLQQTSISAAEEEGNWILYLGSHPLQPPQPRFEFSNPIIKSLAFDDQDGRPKLILTPGPDQMTLRPLLAEGGMVLILDVAQSDPARTGEGRTPRAPESIAPGPAASGGSVVGAGSLPAVVLDPGHGGIDTGARGQNGLSEKDWTWRFTYQVRLALIATGKFRVVMTRNGDQLRSLDQRAITANTNRGTVFVSFHLGHTGAGQRTVAPYIYQPPFGTTTARSAGALSFVPWEEVQNSHLPESLGLAQYLRDELAAIEDIAIREPVSAPVRLLRSVDAPAAFIEVGDLTSLEDSGDLEDPEFILQLAQAVVRAIERFSY